MGQEHTTVPNQYNRNPYPNLLHDSSDEDFNYGLKPYNDKPNKEKEHQSDSTGTIQYTAMAMQGWRKSQEDAHICHTDLPGGEQLFGVFDGHGGRVVSIWVKENFKKTLVELQSYKDANYQQALEECFLKLDDDMKMVRHQNRMTYIKDTIKKDKWERKKARRLFKYYEIYDVIKAEQKIEKAKRKAELEEERRKNPPTPEQLERERMEQMHPRHMHRMEMMGRHHDDYDDMDFMGRRNEDDDNQPEKQREKVVIPPEVPLETLLWQPDTTGEETPAETEQLNTKLVYPNFKSKGGATATVVLITPTQIFCANAGDSRTVVSRADEEALALSTDHKPTNEEEKQRIEGAGGQVSNKRVMGDLGLSRAFGDFEYKTKEGLDAKQQMVTVFPEVKVSQIDDKTQFVFLACDGIWDIKSNQELVDYFMENLYQNNFKGRVTTAQQREESMAALFESCCSKDRFDSNYGLDNMTAILVEIKKGNNNQAGVNKPKQDAIGSPNDCVIQ